MASDVAPSPTLFEILLGSSLHVREVVLSECSILELARFSCASRAARKMSLTEMVSRKLDVTVRVEEKTDENSWQETTALVIKDDFGPTAKINGPVDHVSYPSYNNINNIPNGITVAHRKFATILFSLLAHSRIRNLEIEEEGESPGFHFIHLFLDSGLLDDRKKNDEAVSIPESENEHAMPLEPFYVDTFRVPDNWPCMKLLDFISPRIVIVARSRCEICDDFSHRGMLSAEYVEVEDGDGTLDLVETAVQTLMAPNINVREWITIKENDVHVIIRQWQSGDRSVETFHAKIEEMTDDDGKFKGFAGRIMNSTVNSSEIPYPSDDLIPISVRLQMEKTDKYYESTDDKESRAFVIGRDRDDCCLVVLAKILKTDRVAVGIFQKI